MSQAMPLGFVAVTRHAYADNGGTSDITCPFAPDGWGLFIMPLNSESVLFSFDGVTDHGILIPGTSSPHSYGGSFTDIWLRRQNVFDPSKPSEVFLEASAK